MYGKNLTLEQRQTIERLYAEDVSVYRIAEAIGVTAATVYRDLKRGATVYTAHGAFSGRDEEVITTVLGRRQAVLLRNHIRRVDPASFITIVNSSETIGKGFRSI